LLPDHLYYVWTLPSGDADYPLRCWGLIKRMVSSTCGQQYHRVDWTTPSKTKHSESTFWQSFRVLLTPLAYIHEGNEVLGALNNPESDYSHHRDYINQKKGRNPRSSAFLRKTNN
jgi:putative transposase